MIKGKIWGTTTPLIVTPFIEIHRIVVKPNSRCSIHKHRHKNNLFYCISGDIDIHVEQKDYDLVDVTELGANQFTNVAPGLFHWFETKNRHAIVLEVYYCDALGEDIVRRTVGEHYE